jgi:hypothetical protein
MPGFQQAQSLFQDPEQAVLQRKLAEAEALRQAGGKMDMGEGFRGGKVFIVGNALAPLAQAFGGQYLGNKAEQEHSALMGQRNAADEKFRQDLATASSPIEQKTYTLPEGQVGPVGTDAAVPVSPEEQFQRMSNVVSTAPRYSPTADAARQAMLPLTLGMPFKRMEREDVQADRAATLEKTLAAKKELEAQKRLDKIAEDEKYRRTEETRGKEAAAAERRLLAAIGGGRNANADLQRQIMEQRLEDMKTKSAAGSTAQQKDMLARKDKLNTLNEALTNIDMLLGIDPATQQPAKGGGILKKATGSGIGSLVDKTAGFFGMGTEGAIEGAKIAPLADPILKMVPRFEGPQSDKDTASYKEAAGNLANTDLPKDVRIQSAKTIKEIMTRRRNQFDVLGAAPSTPVAPTGGVVDFGSL